MWQTFWADVIVAIIGAGLTVLIAWATFLLARRRRETQALRALVAELHHRRALSVGNLVVVRGAAELDDFVRANASVLSMRDEIRRTRDFANPNSAVQGVLASMTRACNRYLEQSASRPNHYYFLLDELRAGLSESVHKIAAIRRSVPIQEPGEGAF